MQGILTGLIERYIEKGQICSEKYKNPLPVSHNKDCPQSHPVSRVGLSGYEKEQPPCGAESTQGAQPALEAQPVQGGPRMRHLTVLE